MIKMVLKVSLVCLVVLSLLPVISLQGDKKEAANLCESEEKLSLPLGSADIEAAITNQWGSGAPPIIICGRNAAVGEVVTAPLKEYDEGFHLRAFVDPFPVHGACPGYGYFRDADMSIISRVTLGNRRNLIVIRHAGGRGNYPGSEGYIQLTGGYYIVDVLSDHGPDNSHFGFGIDIDAENGRIEWQGRGGCPACACLENDTKIALVVERLPGGPVYTPFTSTRTTSEDIEASVTNQWGSGAPPLKIFGRDAGVGQVVTAPLSEYDEKFALRAFEDPKPVFSACPGYGYMRDGNMSVISRITLGSGRILVLVMHVGARGYHPGSEGYVQVGNDWYIEKIISAKNNPYSYGFGVRIDQENGTVEWQGRGGCPACACHEDTAFISVVVKKRSNPTISSLEPDSGFIGTTVTIAGSDFGSDPGTVTFNGIGTEVIYSWTDTEIVTQVPPDTTTGPVVVQTAEMKDSNGVIFTVERLGAEVDIHPDTLNRKSKGKWVTAYIELPGGFNVEDIDTATLAVTAVDGDPVVEPLKAELSPSSVGDYDSDGIPDLMVKFDRAGLIALVTPGNRTVTISGKLTGGTDIEGSDTLRVIH